MTTATTTTVVVVLAAVAAICIASASAKPTCVVNAKTCRTAQDMQIPSNGYVGQYCVTTCTCSDCDCSSESEYIPLSVMLGATPDAGFYTSVRFCKSMSDYYPVFDAPADESVRYLVGKPLAKGYTHVTDLKTARVNITLPGNHTLPYAARYFPVGSQP